MNKSIAKRSNRKLAQPDAPIAPDIQAMIGGHLSDNPVTLKSHRKKMWYKWQALGLPLPDDNGRCDMSRYWRGLRFSR